MDDHPRRAPAPDVTCESVRHRRATVGLLTWVTPIGAVVMFCGFGLLLYLEEHAVDAAPWMKDAAGVAAVGGFLSFFVGWGIVGAVNSVQAARTERRLAASGVAGTGVVLRARQTGGAVNDQPQIELLLRVTIPDRAPYVALHCQVIEQLFLARIAPGHSIPVVVDPEDPRGMRVDAKRWETEG